MVALIASGCSGHTTQGQAGGAGGSSVGDKPSPGPGASDAGSGMIVGGSGGYGGGPSSGAGGTPEGGEADLAGDGGSGGALPEPTDILKMKPSPHCGVDPIQETGVFMRRFLQTSGVKAADCADKLNGAPKCGAWSAEREYFVWLPTGYVKTQPYPLVLQAPGCGGTGTQVYSLSPTNTEADIGVNNTVIRVGLTPPPNSIGHATNENQGCFDDKEGDDSVDFVLYEKLLDTLKTELCFDENRVFVVGNSSGAWLANELGSKYAGNTQGYAVRGVVANGGGLPLEAKFAPTSSNQPLAGVWVLEPNDALGSLDWKAPIDRAMKANGCSAANYDTAQFENFPIGAGQPDSTCQRVVGCPPLFPLVVCALPGNGHGSHDSVVNPAAAQLIKVLAAP